MRRTTVLAISGLLVLSGAGIAVPSLGLVDKAFAAEPWPCDASAYTVSGTGSGTTSRTDLRRIDAISGRQISAATIASATGSGGTSSGVWLNAFDYNPVDGSLYGWRRSTAASDTYQNQSTMVRIDYGATPTATVVPGFPTGTGASQQAKTNGAFDGAGNLFVANLTTATTLSYTSINYRDQGAPGYGLKNSISGVASHSTGALAGYAFSGDWAYIAGSLYMVQVTPGSPATSPPILARFEIQDTLGLKETKAADLSIVDEHNRPIAVPANAAFDAAYTDGRALYSIDTANGGLYRTDVTSGATVRIASEISTLKGVTDAGSCATPLPTIALSKTLKARADSADEFTVAVEDPADPAAMMPSATTDSASATPLTADTPTWPVRAGRTYTLRESLAPGSGTADLDAYVRQLTCTNGGAPMTAPAQSADDPGTWQVPVNAGDDIACAVTNIPKPTLQLATTLAGRVDPDDQFALLLEKPGGDTQAAATTSGTQASATTEIEPVVVGQTYRIVDALTAGSPSRAQDYTSTIACTVGGNPDPAPPVLVGTNPMTWEYTVRQAGDVVACGVRNQGNPAPSLSLTTAPAPTQVAAAGDTVAYTFIVTNSGNTAITSLGLPAASFTGTGASSVFPAVACDPLPAGRLARGANLTCTATPYPTTQANIDAGSVATTATIAGVDVNGTPVTSAASASTVRAVHSPSMRLGLEASRTSVTRAGQTVVFTYTITNTGNVTLFAPSVVADAFTGSGSAPAPDCAAAAASLAPGDSTTCTAAYTVTDTDIAARGHIDESAQAVGAGPGPGEDISSTLEHFEIQVEPPELTLVKTATPSVPYGVGRVDFEFVVTNTGLQPVTDVTVAEGEFTGTGGTPAVACPATPSGGLPVGASLTCAAQYTTTAADVAAGSLSNTAVASGAAPDGEAVTSASSTAVLALTPALAIGAPVSPATPTVAAPDGPALARTGGAALPLGLLGTLFVVAGLAVLAKGRGWASPSPAPSANEATPPECLCSPPSTPMNSSSRHSAPEPTDSS